MVKTLRKLPVTTLSVGCTIEFRDTKANIVTLHMALYILHITVDVGGTFMAFAMPYESTIGVLIDCIETLIDRTE